MGVIDLGELGVLPCEPVRTVRYRRDDLHSHGLAKDLADFVSNLESASRSRAENIKKKTCVAHLPQRKSCRFLGRIRVELC